VVRGNRRFWCGLGLGLWLRLRIWIRLRLRLRLWLWLWLWFWLWLRADLENNQPLFFVILLISERFFALEPEQIRRLGLWG